MGLWYKGKELHGPLAKLTRDSLDPPEMFSSFSSFSPSAEAHRLVVHHP